MPTLTIEHHAILFALLSKQAITLFGDEGREAILKAMTKYGNERGQRMAKNALAHGEELTLLNSQAYGEWKPEYPGQMEFGAIGGQPTYRSYIAKCAWCDAWAKHGLMEYGKYYCSNIDNAWYQGFNPEFLCTPLNPAMSWGGDCCRFDWGQPLTDEDMEALARKKKELGTSCMKDFTFHTAHLLSSLSSSLMEELGEKAAAAIDKAKAEYVEKFGQEALDCLEGIF